MQLSVLLTTQNSQELIGDTLASLQWVDEVILLDLASTDHTLAIAQEFPNVTIHRTTATALSSLRQSILSLARNEWLLHLESGEILSKELIQELKEATLDPKQLYWIHTRFFFHGKSLHHCPLSSAWRPRLHHRHHRDIESAPIKNTSSYRLKSSIDSYAFHSVSFLIEAIQKKSEKWPKSTSKVSLKSALFCALTTFFRSYFLQRGFLDGKAGLIFSFAASHTAFYQQLKRQEAQMNVLALDMSDPSDEE